MKGLQLHVTRFRFGDECNCIIRKHNVVRVVKGLKNRGGKTKKVQTGLEFGIQKKKFKKQKKYNNDINNNYFKTCHFTNRQQIKNDEKSGLCDD